MVSKKKYGIVKWIIVAIALIAGIALLSKQKPETVFSNDSKFNDLVYADIISITPESGTSKLGNKTSTTYEGFFCTCETVSGDMIDAYIDSHKYSKYISSPGYSRTTWNRIPEKEEFTSPVRIHGRVSSRESILYASKDKSAVFDIYTAEWTKTTPEGE